MAHSDPTEGMELALNASMERQKALHSQQSQSQDLKLVGRNLGRFMTSLTAEVERIDREMEQGGHTVMECKGYIDGIYEIKMALDKTFAQWQRIGGSEEDRKLETGVERSVNEIRFEADKLVKNISLAISKVAAKRISVTTVSTCQGTHSKNPGAPTTSGRISVTAIPTCQGTTSRDPGVPTTPKESKTQTEKPNPENPHDTVPNEFAAKEVNVPSTSVPEQEDSITYVKKLVAAKSLKGKKRSKAGSKATSIASSAAKLKLRLEEAEARVDAEFSAEITQRDQRALIRNENKAELERQRQAEEVAMEQRIQRERLEMEHREQRERLEMEHRRHEEQLRIERERMEEEARERDADLRRREVTIKAKQMELEKFIEESSVDEGSLSLGVTEIAPSEKVKAYMGQSVKFEPLRALTVVENENLEAPRGAFSEITSTLEGVGGSKCDNVIEPVENSISSTAKGLQSFPYKGLLIYTTPIANPSYSWAPNAPRKTEFPIKTDYHYEPLRLVNPNFGLSANDNKDGLSKVAMKPKRHLKLERSRLTRTPVSIQSYDDYKPISSEPKKISKSAVPTNFDINPSPSTILEHHNSKNEDRFNDRDRLQSTTIGDTSGADRVIEAMCDQLALTRLPLSEPATFDGSNPLQFPMWKMSLDSLTKHRALTDTDKLNLLSRYLRGEAYTAIQGYLFLSLSEAFKESYKLLNERYGDNFVIANTFKDRLKSWPKFGATDTTGLRNFVDFLRQCNTAKRNIQALKCLDDESENIELMKKLPPWLGRQWRRKVSAHREAIGEFPAFEEFIDFLAQEHKIADDPLSRSWQKVEGAKEKKKGTSFLLDSRSPTHFPGTGVCRSFGACVVLQEKTPTS